MMRCIAYASRMIRPVPIDEVHDLAGEAAARNLRIGVTGLLFSISDRFIQVLEGDAETVGALYRRISADPRHGQVIKVLDAAINDRAFADWSMRLVTEDELTGREQAIVIDALRSIDPAFPPPRGAGTLIELLDGELGRVLRDALPAESLAPETLNTFDRLLLAAETIMSQRGAMCAPTLAEVARRADTPEQAVRRYFNSIDDLVAVSVRRVLVIEYRNFLAFMRAYKFREVEEIAVAIVDFIIRCNADRLGLSPAFRRRVAHGHHRMAAVAAISIAQGLARSPPHAGWPRPDIGPWAIAAGLAATESVARALTRDDEAALADPEAPDLLFDACLAAMRERPPASCGEGQQPSFLHA
jgi:AcrR family transcriptional regulator